MMPGLSLARVEFAESSSNRQGCKRSPEHLVYGLMYYCSTANDQLARFDHLVRLCLQFFVTLRSEFVRRNRVTDALFELSRGNALPQRAFCGTTLPTKQCLTFFSVS